MTALGWIDAVPFYAIRDKRTGVLIAGHRRVAVAQELGIEPRYLDMEFEDSDLGDQRRLEIAYASNIGWMKLSTADRRKIVEAIVTDPEGEWTEQSIADQLEVHRSAIQRDIRDLRESGLIAPIKPGAKGGRPRGSKNGPPANTRVTPEMKEAAIIQEQRHRETGEDFSDKKMSAALGIKPSTVGRVREYARGVLDERAKSAAAATAELEPEDDDGAVFECKCPECGYLHFK
jgi:ParB-like chromosome segregation protein Spo0J